MFRLLHKLRDTVREWALRHANGPYAKPWLAVLSFSEASFFPVPPDILLASIILADRARRFVSLAFLTTLASAAGGVFGYAIGYFAFDVFGEAVISVYGLEDKFTYVKSLFNETVFWTVFAAAFTPIPYKVFTLAAGFFKVDFVVFLIASILGRGIRFFVVAYTFHRFGKQISDILYRYFNVISLSLVVALIVYVALK